MTQGSTPHARHRLQTLPDGTELADDEPGPADDEADPRQLPLPLDESDAISGP